MFDNVDINFWVLLIIITVTIVLWVGYRILQNKSDVDLLKLEKKAKKMHKEMLADTPEITDINTQIDKTHNTKTKPKKLDPIDGIMIRQFICNKSYVSDPMGLVDLIYDNLGTNPFPVKIRKSRDIIRPYDLSEIDLIAKCPGDVHDICKKILIENISENENNDNDLTSEQIVIQMIPPQYMREYILSCTDGNIDKLYQINTDPNNKNIIELISLKNLHIHNKKYLRKILYAQHKKTGTTSGTFDIGFYCEELMLPFSDSMTTIVRPTLGITGLSVSPQIVTQMSKDTDIPDPRNQMISYPYIANN
jgi:hypothetical protein